MAAAPVVGLVGMKALRADIKHLTDDQQSALYRAIRDAGKQAAEPIAARARSTVPASSGDHSGRLRGTIRTSGTRTGATVRIGYASVPYAGWLDFGGTRHSPHESTREYVADGRYLFPAAQGLAHEAADLYANAIAHVLQTSGVWTNTTSEGDQVHD